MVGRDHQHALVGAEVAAKIGVQRREVEAPPRHRRAHLAHRVARRARDVGLHVRLVVFHRALCFVLRAFDVALHVRLVVRGRAFGLVLCAFHFGAHALVEVLGQQRMLRVVVDQHRPVPRLAPFGRDRDGAGVVAAHVIDAEVLPGLEVREQRERFLVAGFRRLVDDRLVIDRGDDVAVAQTRTRGGAIRRHR